jgi:hypothetical protein
MNYEIDVPNDRNIDFTKDVTYYQSASHDNGHENIAQSKKNSQTMFCEETAIGSFPMTDSRASDASGYKDISSYIVHTSPTSEEF